MCIFTDSDRACRNVFLALVGYAQQLNAFDDVLKVLDEVVTDMEENGGLEPFSGGDRKA